jgi:hypothetical protein
VMAEKFGGMGSLAAEAKLGLVGPAARDRLESPV